MPAAKLGQATVPSLEQLNLQDNADPAPRPTSVASLSDSLLETVSHDQLEPPVEPSPVKAKDFAAKTPIPEALLRPPVAPRVASAPVLPTQRGGGLGALRQRAPQTGNSRNVPIPPSLQARVAAGLANRNLGTNAPQASVGNNQTHLAPSERIDAAKILGSPGQRLNSPAGIAARRKGAPGLNLGLGDGSPSARVGANGQTAGRPGAHGRRNPPGLSLAGMGGSSSNATPFSNFNRIVDPSGRLSFENKAVLHAQGVDFSSGASFSINMGELDLLEELGRGNYGTVQKVHHKRTKVTMAMKEIRLELDSSKLKAIITELDILHRASAPEIVEFYGAFFIESCVYYCMEFMDAGSLEKLAGVFVPEDVLARITHSMVKGLRFLKDELQTMHRDVKPTNVLANKKGEIKLCDFGVSTQLEKSLAKTNIGCQSYMAPERIQGESLGNVGSYTVASDVWSVGLSIIEVATGNYPYPPDTYSNVFAQLQAIVHGDPPGLPDEYSNDANEFVAACLVKDPNRRPSYAEMMEHPFLAKDNGREVDMAGWVHLALEARVNRLAALSTPTSSSSSDSTNQ